MNLTGLIKGSLTFDSIAAAYVEDYELKHYRSLDSARGRVAHLRAALGALPAAAITPTVIRQYQIARRQAGAAAATVNRETSALSRMFRLAIELDRVADMPRA